MEAKKDAAISLVSTCRSSEAGRVNTKQLWHTGREREREDGKAMDGGGTGDCKSKP